MMLACPRLGERIAPRHPEQVATEIRMQKVEADPAGETAAASPLLRGVTAGDQTAQRRDDPAVDAETGLDLAHVVQKRGCNDGTGGLAAERPLDLAGNAHGMSPVGSRHATPERDLGGK